MKQKQSPWRNPWIIGWLSILGLFLVVSGIRIYLAVTTSPGLVVDNYYERGQDYEQNMLKRQARDPRWQMEIKAPEFVDVAKPAYFEFDIKDRHGQAITPDSVTFYAYRPADAAADFAVPMEQLTLGRYQAEITFPLLGVWDILVSAKRDGGEYSASYRLSAGVK
jgi:nitrogen fixation protein FixH